MERMSDVGSRLYDVTALALTTYARTCYRVRRVGARFELAPRTLVVSSHQSDDDVPVLVTCLYRPAHGLWRRGPRLHFAVRDDLFGPGFFAGYPRGLPRPLRRLLFPVNVGPLLRRYLPCHPIRSATTMRVVELVRDHPEEPLDTLLPLELAQALRRRASEIGAEPRLARDVLSGDYADILWTTVGADAVTGSAAAASWARRRAAAMDDFRALVELVRGGGALTIFPEGRPSPDGTLGPVLGGIGAIVRRARPRAVVPVALGYDPLVPGRPHAFLGIGEPCPPPTDPGEVLALLRRATPLTAGGSVAAALADGADPLDRLAEDVELARGAGRPYEPELDDPAERRERVAVAEGIARGRDVARLVRTYRSARA
jgi:1-acyl-sn-glycerol-3-phosphate acyltransferase